MCKNGKDQEDPAEEDEDPEQHIAHNHDKETVHKDMEDGLLIPFTKVLMCTMVLLVMAVVALVVITTVVVCSDDSDADDRIFRPIKTHRALLAAVDAYLQETTDIKHSEVCLRYGYPIGQWDVSSVRDFSSVFDVDRTNGASRYFNDDISAWDTSEATTMEEMFHGAEFFNQPIGKAWDVSKLVSMRDMFEGARQFNRPIGEWNTSALTSLWGTFHGATSFNQDLSRWDVSSVTEMDHAFAYALVFNQPLEWNTSSVRYLSFMFDHATHFNQSCVIDWDVSSVISMGYMFRNARDFNQPVGANWDTSSLRFTGGMWMDAVSFDRPVDTWDMSKVINTKKMVSSCMQMIATVSHDMVLTIYYEVRSFIDSTRVWIDPWTQHHIVPPAFVDTKDAMVDNSDGNDGDVFWNCDAQGFGFQVAFAATLYYAGLSVYSFLPICLGRKMDTHASSFGSAIYLLTIETYNSPGIHPSCWVSSIPSGCGGRTDTGLVRGPQDIA